MHTNQLFIYSVKRNHRLNYIIAELFERRIGLNVEIVINREQFEHTEGPRLNYSEQFFEGVPQIIPAKLIFEKRIQNQELEISHDSMFKLYSNPLNQLGFDPIAAAFYFLSMHEDYLPHRNDDHGRFSQADRITVKNNVHQLPLVEHYARLVGEWLQSYYPSLSLGTTSSSVCVTIDVDQLFAVKAKGLARSILGLAADFFRGKLLTRIRIIIGKTPDPNEIYSKIIELCESKHIPLIFFMQVGENSRFDINNPPHLNEVKQRINEIALSAEVGIHPSYFSSDDNEKMETEVDRLRSIMSMAVKSSRQHYLRYQIPRTYRDLSELGIAEDYSIGFTDSNGFRAATCKPFRFFDLERDEVLPITIHPMATMDTCALKQHQSVGDALDEMLALKQSVTEVGGQMITTWHAEVLTGQIGAWSSFELLEQFLAHE